MGQDKKVVDGQLRFILARGIGRPLSPLMCRAMWFWACCSDALKDR